MNSKIVLLILANIICITSLSFSQIDEPIPIKPTIENIGDTSIIYNMVEKLPTFVGGEAELAEYIHQNLKYPTKEKEEGKQGTVYIRFVINRRGEVKSAKVIRGINCAALDNEALRLIKEMPNWIPGSQNGVTVNVEFTYPIKFMLDKK